MRRSWIAFTCLFLATAAAARPYGVDDMLRLESYGQILVQPRGSRLIVERRGRYDRAASYAYDWFSRRMTSRILITDLDHPAALRPLFAQDAQAGYWTGGFSPSGRRMVVFRLDTMRLRAGVVDVATGAVRWLKLSPDLPIANPEPVWLDDNRLVFATTHGLPDLLDFPSRAQRTLPALWQKQRDGRTPSSTEISSPAGANSFARSGGLVLVDLARHRETPTLTGTIADLALSADRTTLAVIMFGTPVRSRPDAPVDMAFQTRRRELRLLRLKGGAVETPCVGCDLVPDLLAWSPTGARLLMFARRKEETWEDGRLFVVSPGRAAAPVSLGAVRSTLVHRQESAITVAAAWMGDVPVLFGARPERGGRSDWYRLGAPVAALTNSLDRTSSSRLLAASTNGLVVQDGPTIFHISADGRSTPVARDAERTGVESFDPFSRGSRAMLGTIADPVAVIQQSGEQAHVILDVRDKTIVPVDKGCRPVAVEPGGRGALCFSTDDHGVGTLGLISPRGGVHVIDRINVHLSAIDPATPTALTTHLPDGTSLTDWLYLPPRSRFGTPLPLVVIPYPEAVFSPSAPPPQAPDILVPETSAQLLAAQGFAVLYPSLPLARDQHEPLAAISAQVDRTVDAALATGRIDPRRIAIYGHSYGGYAALALAASSSRYRAIIASAPNASLLMSYGALDPRIKVDLDDVPTAMPFAWHEAGQGRMGAPPWQMPQRYLRNSPFLLADRIATPLLLIQGDMDYVPLGESEQMFMALYRLGRNVTLLRYWGESHVLASPANIRDQYGRIFGWLSRTLDSTPAASCQHQARAQASRLAATTSPP